MAHDLSFIVFFLDVEINVNVKKHQTVQKITFLNPHASKGEGSSTIHPLPMCDDQPPPSIAHVASVGLGQENVVNY